MERHISHTRRSIRVPGYDYGQSGAYFITICSRGRKNIFGQVTGGEMHLNDVGRIVEEEWLKTPLLRPHVELDEFVVMPNHFHGIVFLHAPQPAGTVPRDAGCPYGNGGGSTRARAIWETLGDRHGDHD